MNTVVGDLLDICCIKLGHLNQNVDSVVVIKCALYIRVELE